MTFSGDYNLNNPTNIDQINLQYEMSKPAFKVQWVTQLFYDQIQVKDPCVCYVISDAKDDRIYYGSTLVLPEKHKTKYLIGQEKRDEWILFMSDHNRLISICRYDNPQSAIDALSICNRVGSHYELDIKVYNILISYINGNIDLNAALIGIIADAGYKEHPKFQDLIQWTITLGKYHLDDPKKFPTPYMNYLHDLDKHAEHSLYSFYIRMYEDVFKKNNFFEKESKVEDKTSLDLSEYINKIMDILFIRK